LNLSQIDGDVEAKTSGGHINIEQISGTIKAGTSGGMVKAHFASHPLQACRLETSGGHVEVTLPEDSPVHVDARTSGGRVSTELPVTLTGELGSHLKADVNGGGPELFLRTSGGHIKLYKL